MKNETIQAQCQGVETNAASFQAVETNAANCQEAEANAASWLPYRHGFSGIRIDDERFGTFPFCVELSPGGNRPGGIAIIRTEFYLPIEAAQPAITRGRQRFDAHVAGIREDLITSSEFQGYVEVAKKIKAASTKSNDLAPRIESANKAASDLFTGTEEEHRSADTEAASLEAYRGRLNADIRRLKNELPSLEISLSARAKAIASKRTSAEIDFIMADLNSLCGMIGGNVEESLIKLIELNETRNMIANMTYHSTQHIVAEIVRENAVIEPQAEPVQAFDQSSGRLIVAGVIGSSRVA